MNVRRLLATVVVVALVAPACSRGGKDDDDYVLQLDGRAEVVHDGDERTVETGEHRLATGDTVRMAEGDAVLELPGDRSMRLRAAEAGRDATEVTLSAVPAVVDGDAVVLADDELRFLAGDVEVNLRDGAARVQQALSVTVALYAGAADVRSAGRPFPGGLTALRQVSVPATGLLPRTPSPLVYDETDPDPWDREFLGEAIALGTDLDVRARGFTGQLGPRATVTAPLLRQVLPRLADEDEFGDQLLADAERSPGEALVGAAIVVESDGAPFRARWDDVFAFRDDGARWGLVALDQKVKRDALLGTIGDAVGRSPLLFAASPGDSGGGSGSSAGRGTTTTPTTPGGDDSTTTTTRPDDGSTTTTTEPPVTVPPITLPPLVPEEDSEPEPAPGPGGEPAPTDPVDVVEQVVENLLTGDDGLIQ